MSRPVNMGWIVEWSFDWKKLRFLLLWHGFDYEHNYFFAEQLFWILVDIFL